MPKILKVVVYWEGDDPKDPHAGWDMSRQEFKNQLQAIYNEGWMQMNPNVEHKGFFKTYAERWENEEAQEEEL